jgi:hypothetical protein
MYTNISFVDWYAMLPSPDRIGWYFLFRFPLLLMHALLFHFSFKDPGPVGNGRYSEHMLPEVEIKDFRKGAQVH